MISHNELFTLIQNSDKYITKEENFRPISLLNIYAKYLNNIKSNPTMYQKNNMR